MRNRMTKHLAVLAVLLLSGCVGNPPRPVEIARHDLGDSGEQGGHWPQTGVNVSRVDVRVAAWLDSPAQFYRLSYVDPLRRHSYAENRWVAPPGELLERFLQRRILAERPDGTAPGCRLVLWLDELEQRFDTPRASQLVLAVRASLQPGRGETVLAAHAFQIVQPVSSPDARGGVQATRTAAATLAQDLARWLGELARERPQAITLCKEKP